MAELDGKVAVITGGASGIGEESVRVFIREGAKVVIADMQEELGQALADKLKGSAVFIKTDVSQESQVKAAVDKAVSEWADSTACLITPALVAPSAPLKTPRWKITTSPWMCWLKACFWA